MAESKSLLEPYIQYILNRPEISILCLKTNQFVLNKAVPLSFFTVVISLFDNVFHKINVIILILLYYYLILFRSEHSNVPITFFFRPG